ncbi:MAG: PKD domain-containing protein [Owenweeksia sp.]|nr:PKD domain-containing protein [Owenweeksia sp.]
MYTPDGRLNGRRDSILVQPKLVADILTPDEDSAITCRGLQVNFISESQNADRLEWDFGDQATASDTASGDSISYTYAMPGAYQVRLIASQASGCHDTSTHIISSIRLWSLR